MAGKIDRGRPRKSGRPPPTVCVFESAGGVLSLPNRNCPKRQPSFRVNFTFRFLAQDQPWDIPPAEKIRLRYRQLQICCIVAIFR